MKQLLLLVALCLPSFGLRINHFVDQDRLLAITVVQQTSPTSNCRVATSTATLTCNFTSTPTDGNTLVMVCSGGSSNVGPSSVSGGGVTWQTIKDDHATRSTFILAGPNVSSAANGNVTVTLANNNVTSTNCDGFELSGMPTTITTECTAVVANGTSSTPASNTCTPTGGDTIIVFFVDSNSGSVTGPNNGTAANSPNGASNFSYRIVSSASGSYSEGWVGTVNWQINGAALKGNASGGTAVSQNMMLTGVGN